MVDRRTRYHVLLTVLAVLPAMPVPAWSWGCEGHQTIALIARTHLSAAADRHVRELLEPSPIAADLPRGCPSGGDDLLVQAATWADDVRGAAASPFFGTGHWHFIDLPRGSAAGDITRFCPARNGCLVTAIEQQMAALRAPVTDQQRAAETLMLLVHLVGDLHQPLHCITNDDGGGNCVPVTYFGSVPRLSPEPDSVIYQPNLHAVWDTSIIRRIMWHRSPAWLASVLEQRFAARIGSWQRLPVDIRAWAWESHRVAEHTAYGQLPVPLPVESSQRQSRCADVARRILPLHERLGQRYQDAAVPVIEEQLAKGGVRLAMVLNQVWP